MQTAPDQPPRSPLRYALAPLFLLLAAGAVLLHRSLQPEEAAGVLSSVTAETLRGVGKQPAGPQPNPNRLIVTTDASGPASAQAEQSAVIAGGRVDMRFTSGSTTIEVVEFPDSSTAAAYRYTAGRSSWARTVEVDLPRYSIPADPSPDAGRRQLAESTPWGIRKVYEGQGEGQGVPDASYFPSEVTHPVCIIDSGYAITHPDLPDATAADPSQANPAGRFYFGADICAHGTHVAGTIAAIGGNGEGVVGVYPGAPDLEIVKVFGASDLTSDENSCNWAYSSTILAAVQHCVDSGAKIVSSERVDPHRPELDAGLQTSPP